MTINPELATLLEELNRRAPSNGTTGEAELRREFNDLTRFLRTGSKPARVGAVHDEKVEGVDGVVKVRIYEPLTVTDSPDVLVFIHGGGWVVGDLESADHTARALCRGLD